MRLYADAASAESDSSRVAWQLGRPLARWAPFSALLLFFLFASGVGSALAVDYHPLQFNIAVREGVEHNASGIAIDEATGNVAVTANTAKEVQLFGSDGGPPIGVADTAIGGIPLGESEPAGVAFDNSPSSPSKGALYIASAPFGAAKFVLNGTTEEYELAEHLSPSPSFSEPLGVAVNQDGEVFVSDYGSSSVVRFDPAGNEKAGRIDVSSSVGHASGLAFDSDGNLYVQGYGSGAVYRYEANALGEVEPGAAAVLLVAGGAKGVAVDQITDAVYVAMGSHVEQYDATGVFIREFGEGSLTGTQRLAVAASGEIYVVDRVSSLIVVFGAEGIPDVTSGNAADVGATNAVVEGLVNPEGVELTGCRFEYVTAQAYAASGFSDISSGGSLPCQPGYASIPVDNTPHPVTASLSGLTAAQDYRFRLVASNDAGANRGSPVPFKTFGPPVISSQSVISALFDEATVEALVNPEGADTDVRVEYGLDMSYGQSSPVVPIGKDRSDHAPRVTLTGLQSDVTYHWRFSAENVFGSSKGPDRTFQTFDSTTEAQDCPNEDRRTAASSGLPNCRAYELVSPLDKNNSDIISLIEISGNLARLNQSADSGGKLTYTTSQGFGDTQGVPYVSQYLASRSSDGWENRSISPPQGKPVLGIDQRIDIEARLFTSDLCGDVLAHFTDAFIAPGAPPGVSNLYKRNNCGSPTYGTLTSMPHNPDNIPDLGGASADQRCVAFTVNSPDVFNKSPLYEACDGQTPVLVNVLPGGTTTLKGYAGTVPPGNNEIRSANRVNAVSSDGSHIFWTSVAGPDSPIYVRINPQEGESALDPDERCLEADKACTISLTDSVSKDATGHFWLASADGSTAFFTITSDPLNPSNRGLYAFDTAAGTADFIAPEATAVIGGSTDGARVFFSSKAQIDGSGISGQSNIYLFDSTAPPSNRFHFVATLPPADSKVGTQKLLTPLNEFPYKRTSRVSPNGDTLVFMSKGQLTGYDNTDSRSGEADSEIFVYDATERELLCISCNPAGQRPSGRNVPVESRNDEDNWAAALLPPYQTAFYGSRVVAAGGNRVFFDSYDALVPRDGNAKADVYQWERVNTGSCVAASASYSQSNGGCLSLISSGESPTDSEFVDASADGSDVFFRTDSSLVSQDPGLIDIYDAREYGGFPAPAGQVASCEGEACQAPPSPPAEITPASSSFNGPGNVKAKRKKARCAKGKVHRKARCVRKKRGTPKSHKKQTTHSRGAAR